MNERRHVVSFLHTRVQNFKRNLNSDDPNPHAIFAVIIVLVFMVLGIAALAFTTYYACVGVAFMAKHATTLFIPLAAIILVWIVHEATS